MPWTDKNDALDWQIYFHERNRIITALLLLFVLEPSLTPAGLGALALAAEVAGERGVRIPMTPRPRDGKIDA